MEGYDFMAGDAVVVNGTLHYYLNERAKELVRINFPDREDLVEEAGRLTCREGVTCVIRNLTVLETNDEYAVFRTDEFDGVFVTDKGLFNDYLTVVDTICGAPPIPPETLLDLLIDGL